MAHTNRDIAQENAEEFLSNEIWELVEETHEKYGWNEMFIVQLSKFYPAERELRRALRAYNVKEFSEEYLRQKVGITGSFCLRVKRRPKEVKHVWNLPFERRGNIVVPDGRASSLVLDSIAKLKNGGKHLDPSTYASLGL